VLAADMLPPEAVAVTAPVAGKITFISPQVEFTPPVIYSQDMRSKLSYMIEISFSPEAAENLKPGQPVEVRLNND
jgi:HlyD family secretion protein